jgi:hypothetical protein
MDPKELYPNGFSMFYPHLNPMQSDLAVMRRQSSVGPLKYFINGYGKAKRFNPDITSPESTFDFQKDVSDMGILLDITINVSRSVVLIAIRHASEGNTQSYFTMESMLPLTNAMCNKDPRRRPSAKDALSQFNTIRSSLTKGYLQRSIASATGHHPKYQDEGVWDSFMSRCRDVVGAIFY